MTKKGFTLTELLGVLVLLSLLAMILIPNISKSLKEGRENADKQAKENIVLAARSWASSHKNMLPSNSETYNVKLADLQNEGYLDKNIKIPSTGENLNNICVTITNVGVTEQGKQKYTYEYNEKGC